MLTEIWSQIKHFLKHDIWQQKWRILLLLLLSGVYFGIVNFYISQDSWYSNNQNLLQSSQELCTKSIKCNTLESVFENSRQLTLGIISNIPQDQKIIVIYLLSISGISLLSGIIYLLYSRIKNFLYPLKIVFIILSFPILFYSFGKEVFDVQNFLFFLGLALLIGVSTYYLLGGFYKWAKVGILIKPESLKETDMPLGFYPNPKNLKQSEINEDGIIKMQQLGYDEIAKNLARRLKEEIEKDKSPEVIGIEGEWGSGKSSFINLVKYYVKNKEKSSFPKGAIKFESASQKRWKFSLSINYLDLKKYFKDRYFPDITPTFLEFNPWYFESTTNLLDSFFLSLSEHIEQHYHIDTGSVFRDFTKSIGNISEFEFFGIRFKRGNNPTSPDYDIKRERLNNILCSLESPIIVIIDDLDRVNLEQCKQVFQLIYLSSGLKNIHFLVSYDSEKFNSIDVPTFVTHSKEKMNDSYTEYRISPILEYIQKIIHSKVLITPELRGLKKYMATELRNVFQSIDGIDYPEGNSIFERAMNKLYSPKSYIIYSKYLSTPRSVKRLILSIKGFMGREDYHKYLVSTDSSLISIIKMGIIFLNNNGLFRKIINEVSLVDEMNQVDAKDYSVADDIIFYPLEIVSLFEAVEKDRLKRLDEYCKNNSNKDESNIIKDIFSTDIVGSKLQAKDLKIAIDLFLVKTNTTFIKGRGFFQSISGTVKELMYLEQFSYDAFSFYSLALSKDLSTFLKNISESNFYGNQNSKVKNIINDTFIRENHAFIIDKTLGYFRDHIRDMNEIPYIWIRDFYGQLFLELKSSDFPFPEGEKKFSDTLLGHISDNIGLSIYSLIFWIERQRGYFDWQQVRAQIILREIFDNPKLFENWGIFGASYLIRLWSGLNERKYGTLLSEDTRTWIAQFVYEIFAKHYIIPRKTFLTGDPIIDRYWINFVRYQFMSQKEMGDIVISESNNEKIGDKIGEYFQNEIYADTQFGDILLLFKYLVAMGYTYSDEFRTRYLHYSGESDWNDNPYMKKILKHFQSKIEDYIRDHSDEKVMINSRYDGHDAREFSISEVWEHLKKVTKLDEEV